MFEGVIDLFPVSGWQVVQEHDCVRILVSGAEAEHIDEPLLYALREALEKLGAVVPTFSIEHVSAIPRGLSGKAPLVISHLSRVPV